VRLLLALAAVALTGGCAVAVVGAGTAVAYSTLEDRRSTGTQFEDEKIESRAGSAIDKAFGWKVHVNVTSFNRAVLITGEVPDAASRSQVEKIVVGVGNVRSVANELVIGPLSSLPARTGDSFVTSKVKTRFIDSKAFSALHVKVVTEAGAVYLMGIVTDKEADAAVEIARTTDGVKKVVKVFELCKSGESVCRPLEPADKPKSGA
jgi:osmotically-inducible protein OsmY